MYQILSQNIATEGESVSNTNVEDIVVPYLTKLKEQLSVGTFIEIFAKIDENADRLEINLLTDSNDIALHINPRLEEGVVVRNSWINNEWCNEEREPLINPFEKNKSFTLVITVEKDVYRLFVNGIHFVDFSHRLPFNGVTSLQIEGKLQVLWIKFDRIEDGSNWDAFSSALTNTASPLQQFNEVQTFFEPTVPFVQTIDKGLRVGMVLSIIGRPLSNAQKFDINLVQVDSSSRVPNLSFHMSTRFRESMVVFNHRYSGEWGSEERYTNGFPFLNEKIFDMRIIVETNRFIIIINGKNFTEFANRLYPLSDTNQLEINGNLKLFSVRF